MRIGTAVVGVVLIGMLGACAAPAAPGSGTGGGQPGAPVEHPWDVDDVSVYSGVVSGEFMGVPMRGFTCDVSLYVAAESVDGVLPRANASVSPGSSGIDYQDEAGISTALGPGVALTGSETAVSVTTDQGYWQIGDGGQNTPWAPSADLTIEPVPVPENGCDAADLWAREMMRDGAEASELSTALIHIGLIDVSDDLDCVEQGIAWVPPEVTCEEFWDRVEASY